MDAVAVEAAQRDESAVSTLLEILAIKRLINSGLLSVEQVSTLLEILAAYCLGETDDLPSIVSTLLEILGLWNRLQKYSTF